MEDRLKDFIKYYADRYRNNWTNASESVEKERKKRFREDCERSADFLSVLIQIYTGELRHSHSSLREWIAENLKWDKEYRIYRFDLD